MNIVEHIITANGGRQTAAIAAAAGIGTGDFEALLRRQAPLIARRIHQRAREDAAELETIFDILEEGEAEEYLRSPRALTSRAAVEDGEDILAHLFGSAGAARAEAQAAGIPEGTGPELAGRLMTYSAVLTVAAMSRRRRAEVLPALSSADASTAGGGLIAMIAAALMEGLVRGLKKALLPRRRRRRRYSARYRRNARRRARGRSRPRRRRRAAPRDRSVLEEILRGVLKGR